MTDKEVMQMALDALELLNGAQTTDGIFIYTDQETKVLRAALAQPEPEHDLEDVRCEGCGYMTYHREHMGCIRAAAKKEWVGLTDDEKKAIYEKADVENWHDQPLLEAVEAKLKEKNT